LIKLFSQLNEYFMYCELNIDTCISALVMWTVMASR